MKKVKNEHDELQRQVAQREAKLTTRGHGVATAIRANLRGFRMEVNRVVVRAFEGLDHLNGATEVKAEDVFNLLVDTPPSLPNLSEQPLQPTLPPKRRVLLRALTSGTAKKGPVTKKPRAE